MAAMAFLITIVLGYPYLNYLRRGGFGKKVRIEGPSTHRVYVTPGGAALNLSMRLMK